MTLPITHLDTPYSNERRAQFLIIHAVTTTEEWAINAYQGKTHLEVSPHYSISQDGTIVQYVEEEKRAWHAGVCYWEGFTDLNSLSIGIEFLNPEPKHEFGVVPFTPEQVAAGIALCQDIVKRHKIRPDRVLGHQDIAPHRKPDPGKLFPWRDCAAAGVGLFPEAESCSRLFPLDRQRDLLRAYGYDVRLWDQPEARAAIIKAFQTHFHAAAITGTMDETDCAMLQALVEEKHKLELAA